MDILFDARMLDRPMSGLERVQLNVLRELSLLPKVKRLRVVLIKHTQTAKPLPESVERCEVFTTEDIVKVLTDEKERPDVYHMTWFPDTTPRDLFLPLIAPASVVEVHDAILNRHPEYFPDREHWDWYNAFIKRLIRNSDRLLVHSKSVASEIEKDLQGNAAIADVAPLAVDPDFHTPLSAAEVKKRCKRIGFEGDFVLAVGKDYPHKDHATLLRAMARLPANVRLCIAGTKIWKNPGETSDEIIAQLKLGDRVQWVQGLDDQDIKALIQGCRAMAYPSLEEGFGIPPIEAMALRTPVVAARAMSIPEVCGDGAWLHAPGNDRELEQYLRKCLAGGPDVQALIERGVAREKTFSWKRTAELTFASYEKAIASAKSGKSPRKRLDPVVYESLAIAARYKFNDLERELAAWQRRAHGAEVQLNTARVHATQLEHQLRELGERPKAPPPPPKTEPKAEPEASRAPASSEKRPRWSLKRRIKKIKDGLARRRKA
ncbi:MAG: glycosyltransferase family 4 protein [Planctomycetes bacterium]|nr:glycosyltransferase family 4 protein [Planctomycetota bacterium]